MSFIIQKPSYKKSTLWKIRGIKNWEEISSAPSITFGKMWFRVLVKADESPVSLACAISKKYGGATKRNLCKRRIKSVIRKFSSEDKIPEGTVILAGIVNLNKSELSFSEIEKSCIELISYINKIKATNYDNEKTQ